jgi:hypothetical protein
MHTKKINISSAIAQLQVVLLYLARTGYYQRVSRFWFLSTKAIFPEVLYSLLWVVFKNGKEINQCIVSTRKGHELLIQKIVSRCMLTATEPVKNKREYVTHTLCPRGRNHDANYARNIARSDHPPRCPPRQKAAHHIAIAADSARQP